MSKLADKIVVIATSALLAVSAIGSASATTWVVTNVLSVNNDGGFAASSFHDAQGNLMSGTNLGAIGGGPGVLGTYNDVSGAFNMIASVNQSGN